MEPDFQTQPGLFNLLACEFACGVELLTAVDDVNYRRPGNNSGTVGGQFRHNLDFGACLLNGVGSGLIDYTDRERDVRVEIDREYAAERYGEAIMRIRGLEPRLLGKRVLVRSEVDPDTWLPSSVAREAEFVHSHTVHHHALIAEKLAGFGAVTGSTFGVAPSTLAFWKSKAA